MQWLRAWILSQGGEVTEGVEGEMPGLLRGAGWERQTWKEGASPREAACRLPRLRLGQRSSPRPPCPLQTHVALPGVKGGNFGCAVWSCLELCWHEGNGLALPQAPWFHFPVHFHVLVFMVVISFCTEHLVCLCWEGSPSRTLLFCSVSTCFHCSLS